MNEMQKGAIELINRGLNVFPIRPNSKSEYTDDTTATDKPWYRPGATRRDATRETTKVVTWWTEVPGCNIGVLLDHLHVCVDVDVRNKGLESSKEFEWIATYTEQTATGGYHVVYQMPEPITTPPFVIAPGVEILTGSSVFVAAPSIVPSGHYKVTRPYQIATCPSWLLDEIRLHIKTPNVAKESGEIREMTRYGQAALEKEVARIATLPEGNRAYMLNAIVYNLARLIPSGALTETTITTAIEQATRGWKEQGKIRNIVTRAIKTGRTNPRDVSFKQKAQ
jgi:hypothetical protein